MLQHVEWVVITPQKSVLLNDLHLQMRTAFNLTVITWILRTPNGKKKTLCKSHMVFCILLNGSALLNRRSPKMILPMPNSDINSKPIEED